LSSPFDEAQGERGFVYGFEFFPFVLSMSKHENSISQRVNKTDPISVTAAISIAPSVKPMPTVRSL